MHFKPLSIVWNVTLSWWRHQMETFSALLALYAGNSPVPGEFTAQRPVTRRFDVFFDLRLNKRLSKQWWGRWFETPSHSLWRHCNVMACEIPQAAVAWDALLVICINFSPSTNNWISDYIHYKMWNVIAYLLPNVKCPTVEVWEWIGIFWTKWTTICRWYFQTYVLQWKQSYFEPNFPEVCF